MMYLESLKYWTGTSILVDICFFVFVFKQIESQEFEIRKVLEKKNIILGLLKFLNFTSFWIGLFIGWRILSEV
jgi:hypothetical protein